MEMQLFSLPITLFLTRSHLAPYVCRFGSKGCVFCKIVSVAAASHEVSWRNCQIFPSFESCLLQRFELLEESANELLTGSQRADCRNDAATATTPPSLVKSRVSQTNCPGFCPPRRFLTPKTRLAILRGRPPVRLQR